MSLANIYLESKVRGPDTDVMNMELKQKIGFDAHFPTGIKRLYVLHVAPSSEDALLPMIYALYTVIVP